MSADQHDADKVIKLEPLKKQLVDDYMAGNVDRKTHPINEEACDANQQIENAKVAANSCMHGCVWSDAVETRRLEKGADFLFQRS